MILTHKHINTNIVICNILHISLDTLCNAMHTIQQGNGCYVTIISNYSSRQRAQFLRAQNTHSRSRSNFFVIVGHEILIYFINHIIDIPLKIVNIADKNWANVF